MSLKVGLAPRDRRWARVPQQFAEMRVEREKLKHVAGSGHVTKPGRQWTGRNLGKKGRNYN